MARGFATGSLVAILIHVSEFFSHRVRVEKIRALHAFFLLTPRGATRIAAKFDTPIRAILQ